MQLHLILFLDTSFNQVPNLLLYFAAIARITDINITESTFLDFNFVLAYILWGNGYR